MNLIEASKATKTAADTLDRKRFGKTYVKDDNDELVPVPSDPEESPVTEQIFEDALARLKDRVKEVEEAAASLSLTSVSIPQHFNDTMLVYATRAILRSETHMVRPWQVRRGYNAVRMAYHLNNAEAFGVPEEDFEEDDSHHLLHLDLNDQHLEFCIANVGEFQFTVQARQTLGNLGAKGSVRRTCFSPHCTRTFC